MLLEIDDKANVEDFIIEDNILKGNSGNFVDTPEIGQIILDTFDSKPNHVAQIEAETGNQTTFAEMKDRSIRCGLWMKHNGIGSGDIVTICSDNHLDVYAPICGTFYIGATCNAWYHQLTLKPACHLMKLLKPRAIFASKNAVDVLLEAARIENVKTTIIVFGKYQGLQSYGDIIQTQSNDEITSFLPQKINNPESAAMIILTSGSSGFPKGATHSYKSILKIMQSFLAYPYKDISLWYSTTFWLTGFVLPFVSIFTRGTRIIHSGFDPEQTCRVIEKYKVQRLFAAPIVINYLCKSKVLSKYTLKSLELVIIGGSKMSPDILLEFKESLPHVLAIQAFAMSETGRFATSQTENSKILQSVGFVSPGTQLKIIDVDTNRTLGPNEPGEICLKPITMMIGYYNDPEMTKQAIDEEGWLHSGDKGYYDENGEVIIVDRLKDVMLYQAHHVSPNEIEEVLQNHPGVLEVAVVPVPNKIDGQLPMAFVKKVPDSNVTEEELVELSRKSLGEFKKLRAGVVFLDDLPKTPSGKIEKASLKERAKQYAQKFMQ